VKEIDKGHCYDLIWLDADEFDIAIPLRFVKRKGIKYPWNADSYSGTNMQDVLRAVLARIAYLDAQEEHEVNELAAGLIGQAIWLFEKRAAIRHGREVPTRLEAVFGDICQKCGHVGCKGECK